MKKILLTCLVAVSVFAVNAQTKKSKKAPKISKTEARANAKFAKQEEAKKLMRDSVMFAMHSEDSLRLENDSLSDVQKEADRVVYKDAGLKAIDSTNKVRYAELMQGRSQQDKAQRNSYEIAKAAKLSDYETKQVSLINETYNQKAKAVTDNVSLDETAKKQQLVALNTERVAKIKVIAGKSGAKKLEKQRKEFAQKNGGDAASSWIDMAEGYAKNS